MTMLQQAAVQLPMWMGKSSESPPSLCGCIQAEANYVAQQGDHVAARVRTPDGEEQLILAEIVSFNPSTNKYDVDDIDEEAGRNGKERHHLSRRRVIPLPKTKANPITHPQALFQKDQIVMALYPQTTCFYKAVIHEPPTRPQDDYLVSFEDTSYADGFAPPLNVPQRYVVASKETRKR